MIFIIITCSFKMTMKQVFIPKNAENFRRTYFWKERLSYMYCYLLNVQIIIKAISCSFSFPPYANFDHFSDLPLLRTEHFAKRKESISYSCAANSSDRSKISAEIARNCSRIRISFKLPDTLEEIDRSGHLT